MMTTLLGIGLLTVLPGAPGAAAERGALAGRWALLQVTATTAQVPVIGRVRAATRALSVHELRVQDDRLRGAGELCDVQVDSGSRVVRTVLPRAFIQALPPPVIDAEIAQDEGGLRLRQGRRTLVVGAHLDQPDAEPLPGDAADRRVIDQDRDGRPGMTINVQGLVRGEIYVVQRSWSALEGRADAEGGFRGQVAFGSEQRVLGATSRLLRGAPPSAPDPARSFFRLVRLPDGGGCAAARRALGWAP